MSFERIAIVGLGLIGGSLAAACKRKKVAATIHGIDHERVVKKALSRRLIDVGFSLKEISEGIVGADLIILATPIQEILDTLTLISAQAKVGTLVTDVGSTKVKIVNEANKRLPQGVYFLGGHPMAGSEKGGIENADPLLFENAIYVLTKNETIPAKLVQQFVELIEGIGARSVFLSAQQHDEIAAVVSHLPHILAVALMTYAARLNEANSSYLNLAAGGFRDMTRVASSPFDVWRDILNTNRQSIESAIDQFVNQLKSIKELLRSSQLELVFTEAARKRLSIPRDTRGFLRPHFDLFVVVEDKPGVIAAISTIMARENINIKDIEVVKVREGDAGTLRLAFESENNRIHARQLLWQNGFQAQIKD